MGINEGIVEITGLKGTGKTTFVTSIIKDSSAVIYNTKKFPINCILKQKRFSNEISSQKVMGCLETKKLEYKSCNINNNLYLKPVHNLENLLFSILYQLELFIFLKGINIIIIDSLDSLLIGRDDKIYYKEIFSIINKLRYFNIKYEISVYIINEFVYFKDNGVSNYYLGNAWNYLINKRIVLTKFKDIRKCEVIYFYKDLNKSFYFEIVDCNIIIKDQ